MKRPAAKDEKRLLDRIINRAHQLRAAIGELDGTTLDDLAATKDAMAEIEHLMTVLTFLEEAATQTRKRIGGKSGPAPKTFALSTLVASACKGWESLTGKDAQFKSHTVKMPPPVWEYVVKAVRRAGWDKRKAREEAIAHALRGFLSGREAWRTSVPVQRLNRLRAEQEELQGEVAASKLPAPAQNLSK